MGALEIERPFLGPLHRFLSLHPRSSVREVPPYIRLFLRCLADRVSSSRHYNCAVSTEGTTVAPRVYAQASNERTWIRGWFPQRDEMASSMSEGRDGFHSNSRRKTGFGSAPLAENPLLSFHFAVLVTKKHRRPRERCSADQADEHQVSRIRSAHGTGYVHEENELADGRSRTATRKILTRACVSTSMSARCAGTSWQQPWKQGVQQNASLKRHESKEHSRTDRGERGGGGQRNGYVCRARGGIAAQRKNPVPWTSPVSSDSKAESSYSPSASFPLLFYLSFALSLLLLPFPSFPFCASSVQTGSYTARCAGVFLFSRILVRPGPEPLTQ